ncbi:MAG: hypothetical protein KKG47_16870 [Proteobacteria bacterium]|nr:hypothetical protein [Pseudomonadota bacterium]MBU1736518.1 hypothetical protein [Pseudomonadota bacterium]
MKESKDRERDFIDDVQRTLQEKGEKLDPEILLKLSAMRGRVVESRSSYRFPGMWRVLRVPATVLMILGILYVFTLVFYQAPAGIYSSLTSLEDMEILVAEEGPDFFAELDFYTWLAAEKEGAP